MLRENDEGKGADSAGILFGSSRQGDWKDRRISERPATDEEALRDEFFKDAGLHDPQGKNIMLLGLDVLPDYRRQGLATAIVSRYLERERKQGRKTIILTCLEGKVKMYEKMGFQNQGISGSSWGGEQWYEMSCVLN